MRKEIYPFSELSETPLSNEQYAELAYEHAKWAVVIVTNEQKCIAYESYQRFEREWLDENPENVEWYSCGFHKGVIREATKFKKRIIMSVEPDIYNEIFKAANKMGLKPADVIKVWVYDRLQPQK